MTIQEAIKSGKAFRRRHFVGEYFWFRVNNDDGYIFDFYHDRYNPTVVDILADDWIVRE